MALFVQQTLLWKGYLISQNRFFTSEKTINNSEKWISLVKYTHIHKNSIRTFITLTKKFHFKFISFLLLHNVSHRFSTLSNPFSTSNCTFTLYANSIMQQLLSNCSKPSDTQFDLKIVFISHFTTTNSKLFFEKWKLTHCDRNCSLLTRITKETYLLDVNWMKGFQAQKKERRNINLHIACTHSAKCLHSNEHNWAQVVALLHQIYFALTKIYVEGERTQRWKLDSVDKYDGGLIAVWRFLYDWRWHYARRTMMEKQNRNVPQTHRKYSHIHTDLTVSFTFGFLHASLGNS